MAVLNPWTVQKVRHGSCFLFSLKYIILVPMLVVFRLNLSKTSFIRQINKVMQRSEANNLHVTRTNILSFIFSKNIQISTNWTFFQLKLEKCIILQLPLLFNENVVFDSNRKAILNENLSLAKNTIKFVNGVLTSI